MCPEEQVSVSLTLQYFIFILNYLFQRILSNSVASGDSGNFLGRTRSLGPVCTAQLPQASRVLPLLGVGSVLPPAPLPVSRLGVLPRLLPVCLPPA